MTAERVFLKLLGLLGVMTLVLIASDRAGAEPNELIVLKDDCTARIIGLEKEIRSTELWLAVISIGGAIIGAIGAIASGFITKKASARKAAAIVGALGAVVASLNQVLPNTENLRAIHSVAAIHQTLGISVYYQMAESERKNPESEGRRFAVARFTQCLSPSPDTEIPPLPSPIFSKSGGEQGVDY